MTALIFFVLSMVALFGVGLLMSIGFTPAYLIDYKQHKLFITTLKTTLALGEEAWEREKKYSWKLRGTDVTLNGGYGENYRFWIGSTKAPQSWRLTHIAKSHLDGWEEQHQKRKAKKKVDERQQRAEAYLVKNFATLQRLHDEALVRKSKARVEKTYTPLLWEKDPLAALKQRLLGSDKK